jgi:fucose 4-O-acetylase-like acetyltransferase
MDQNDRVGWVDIFRGLAIILVVFGHCGRGLDHAGLMHFEHGFVDRWIYAFHMPAFFFAAGLFAGQSLMVKGPGRFFVDKVRTVLYPYVFWSVFFILAVKFFPGANTHYQSDLWGHILYRPVGNYWFLYALFLIQIAFLCVRPWRNGPLMFYVLSTVAWGLESAGILEGVFPHEHWWPLHDVLKYGIYFAAGDAVATLTERPTSWPNDSGLFALMFFAGLTILVGLGHSGEYGFWDFALAAAGIQGLWELSVALDQRGCRWLRYLGERSLEIYVAHNLATSATRLVLLKGGVTSPGLHLICGTAAGIIGPLVLCWVCERLRFRWLFRL